jgi:hypothetical protein
VRVGDQVKLTTAAEQCQAFSVERVQCEHGEDDTECGDWIMNTVKMSVQREERRGGDDTGRRRAFGHEPKQCKQLQWARERCDKRQ